jgi:hypothetical protein
MLCRGRHVCPFRAVRDGAAVGEEDKWAQPSRENRISPVTTFRWRGAGDATGMELTMTHDKIKAAARTRMAATGEPYATARRAVVAEQQARFFAINFDSHGLNWITKYADTLFGGGPGRAGVFVYPDHLRIKMGVFRLDVPRSSIRHAQASTEKLHGTSGVHSTPKGRLLINGCDRGLVEFEVDPPVRRRGFAALIPRPAVRRVILSLESPAEFIETLASPTQAETPMRERVG